MNTHELLELTMLHALGMLDDSEREAYEAAFDAAPASVQKRVRDEARRMADLGALMPDVEPDQELRTMVLAAVRAAMREEENESRIAQQAAGATPIIAKIDANTPAPVRATSQPRLSTSPRVHRVWRALAITSVAAAVTMGVFMVSMTQTMKLANNNTLVNSLYDQIGARYLESTIFDANTQRVALTSTDNNNTAVAAVWHNPDWDSARLFVKNLSSEQNRPLRLVVLDENDNIVEVIKTFTPTGRLEDFNVEVNLNTQRKLAIYPDADEAIIEALEPVLMSTDTSL
jgi:hypothetical protein